MKLRIRGNSVRLRLLQSEVAELAVSKRIAETTVFGSSAKEVLTYAVQISNDATEVTVGFCENEICVILPNETAAEWIDTEQVGINVKIEDGDREMDILVEKDFVCMTRTDDPDNHDAFPNPDGEC
jgi:hypothetical protein